jgi:hypothetical protein
MSRDVRPLVLIAAAVFLVTVAVRAQDMPDPSEMHGRALPAGDLPPGTVTVRVVREALGNNLPDQQVRVTVGRTVRTATTDDQGRAEFKDLPKGTDVVAEVTVDGERLQSQPFNVPTSGGIRVALVAGLAKAAERKKQEEAKSAAEPPVKGTVVFGPNTRTLIQFNDDRLEVFYVLEIVNSARARVDIGGPLVLELPREALGASTIEGSSPSATVSNGRLVVTGPFASGTTAVQVGFRLPYNSNELTLSQVWPAAMQRVVVGVERLEGVSVSSPQFASTNDVPTGDGTVYILGSGPALPAGGTTTVTLSGLPHHTRTSLYIALGIAASIVALGVWLAIGRTGKQQARQALIARRNTLLGQLAQLESKHRAGAVDASYTARRQRMLTELERIYGELDETVQSTPRGTGPEGGGEGVAA